MLKTAVPIMATTINDDNKHIYLENIKEAGVERVFIAVETYLHDPDGRVNKNPESIKKLIDFFRENGLEVGVWTSALGHGEVLMHESGEVKKFPFTPMEGADGSFNAGVFCPSDENYTRVFCEGIKKLAQMNPDIIMLDDDFRFNTRKSVVTACFCPKHLDMYYDRIKEKICRDDIKKLIFSGGKNKYRTQYFSMLGETLLDFAKAVRQSVDSVNPKVRVGSCSCCDSWELSGVTPMELAKAFAGNTKPFLRTIGAPYWKSRVIDVIEDTRLQMSWGKGAAEIFSEGDVYPRPRYKVPSKRLENFHLALLCDGSGDGILKYMFDYTFKPEYEKGYLNHHMKNADVRQKINESFMGKKCVGVYAYNVLGKNENYSLAEKFEEKSVNKMAIGYRSNATALLSANSIPTCYENSGYPLLVFGENAKYVSLEELQQGAILDIKAAKILQGRGIDTGLSESGEGTFSGEYFPDMEETVYNIGSRGHGKIICNKKAEVKSCFVPGNYPAAYTYENDEKMRFFVLAMHFDELGEVPTYTEINVETNYTNNYCRQKQFVDAIEWIGKKKLPAVCLKNPDLFMLTKAGENSLSVAMVNDFQDEIISPTVKLDRAYKNIRFINCDGRLEGDRVYLSDIPSFGFAAFEVEEDTV